MDRRSFCQSSLVAGMGVLAPQLRAQESAQSGNLEVHLFSKHLQFLDYKEMAKIAAEIGFDGVELTVRPKGHVEPKNVKASLPVAVAALREAGLLATMVASDVNNLSAEYSHDVLQVLSKLNIEKYRMRYYRYPKQGDLLESVREFRSQAEELVTYNRDHNLCAVYQNHAGTHFGSSMWEIRQMCDGFDPQWIGCQYDIRHATVEGGLSWQKEIRLVLPFIRSIVAKDYLWHQVDGRWKVQNVPLGEGMVDFKTYFRMLKDLELHVPAVLHLEYPLEGAEHGDRDLNQGKREVVYKAMKRDLTKLKSLWHEA